MERHPSGAWGCREGRDTLRGGNTDCCPPRREDFRGPLPAGVSRLHPLSEPALALRSRHETTFPRAGRAGVVTPGVATVRPTVAGLCLLISRDVTSDRGDTTPANHAERVPTCHAGPPCSMAAPQGLRCERLAGQVTGPAGQSLRAERLGRLGADNPETAAGTAPQKSVSAPIQISKPLGDKGPEPKSAAKRDFRGGLLAAQQSQHPCAERSPVRMGRLASPHGIEQLQEPEILLARERTTHVPRKVILFRLPH